MTRTVRLGVTGLLVEGAKDVRVYRNLVDESACEVTPTEGKQNALDALEILRKSGEKGLLIILDADFTLLEPRRSSDPDVVLTDGHDLEVVLVRSPALEKVLIENDLQPSAFGKDLRLALARAVKPLGYLRLASLRFRLNLDFKKIDFRSFTVPSPSIAVDVAKLCAEVRRKNPACGHTPSDLADMIRRVARPEHDVWHVACGHDITEVLALALARKLKRKQKRDFTASELERQLRLSYEAEHFRKTKLHDQIRDWEVRNSPYRVLPLIAATSK